MRKKLILEYIFTSSRKSLFDQISTPEGLQSWFADRVEQVGSTFTFYWGDSFEVAELIEIKKLELVKFKWEEYPDEYFQFSIDEDPITLDLALCITDFVDDDEEGDISNLWDEQIDQLRRTIGLG